MSQIYELLNKNKGDVMNKEIDMTTSKSIDNQQESFLQIPPLDIHSQEKAKQEFECLYKNLTLLGLKKIRSIMICGLCEDNNLMLSMSLASTIVLNEPLKILVVDANMDSPCLYKHEVGFRRAGFCDFLREYRSVDHYVMPSNNPRLFGMKLGLMENGERELINSFRIDTAIKTFQSYYDMIILDGPPAISDSCLPLAKSVEGVILVLHMGVSADLAKKARNTLEQIQARVLGAILC